MVPGVAVGSANLLNLLIISAVANSAVDLDATDAMVETADKSLMNKFPQMGMKSGV